MTLPVSVDRADSGRYPLIIELLFDVYVGGGYTDAEIARRMFVPSELRRRGEIFIALTAGAEIAGTVILAEPSSPSRQIARASEAEIHLLAVHPKYRANGVGAALLKECHGRARSKGYSRMVLSTQPAMHAAQRLYERLGYRRNASRDWQARGRQYLAYEKSLSEQDLP